MKTDSPLPNSNRVSGCVQRLVRFLLPSLTLTRRESLEAIRSLQSKLNEARADANEWRDRALSAERVIACQFPQALKESVKEHDEKFGTSLLWRL